MGRPMNDIKKLEIFKHIRLTVKKEIARIILLTEIH